MSSVSGSDNYNYFQKQISDMSDDNATERKKIKEREDENLADIQRRHAADLKDAEETHSRALSRAKDASNETLHTERESNKSDYDRLKKDTYDRFGRLNQDNSHEARQNIEELQQNLISQKNRHDEEMNQAERKFNTQISERDHAANYDREQAVQATRDGLGETHRNSSQILRDSTAQALSEANQKYNNLDKARLEEMDSQRRAYDGAFDQSRLDYGRRIEMAKNAYEKSSGRQDKAIRDFQSDETNKLRTSHERETQQLRDQMGDLVQAEKSYVKDGAQGKSEAVAEFENDWRNKLALTQSNSQNEIADLKTQNAKTEHFLGRQNSESLNEKETFFSNLIAKQANQNHAEQRDLAAAAQKDHNDLEKSAHKEREANVRISEERLTESARRSDQALIDQAKTLSKTAETERQTDRFQIEQLQGALQERKTSADTTLISPSAEASVRKQISGQYEKVAQADQDRRLRENNQIRDDYKHALREEQDKGLIKENKLNRTIAYSQNDDRQRFNAHVADLEYMKESAIRTVQSDQDRERDNMNKTYSRTLERQTREHDESSTVTREQAQSRISSLREENEFNSKMAQREFANKYNETVRDYERKMNDQKTDYEVRLEDQRAQNSSMSRDAERKFKNQLDEQTRNNDQKLAQQEAQHKERERYITQTFQDELEKMRRSNQMLVNKRG